MTQSAAFKAMWKLAMPNIIAPQRATRRFRRFMDDTFLFTDPVHLDKLLSTPELIDIEENSGDTEALIKQFELFEKKIISAISRIEDAEWGMINELKDEEFELQEKFRKIKKDLVLEEKRFQTEKRTLDRKGLENLNPEAYRLILKMVDEDVIKIQKLMLRMMEELQKRELLIGRGRDQLRSYVFKTESNMKHDLNFNPFKINDQNKEIRKTFQDIISNERIKNEKGMKLLENDLKKLIDLVNGSMKLIFDEMIDLIEMILQIIKSLDHVYEAHVEKKLYHHMHLPEKKKEEIHKIFLRIEEHIRKQAEVDFEAIKKVIQNVHGLSNIQ